MIKAIVFDFSRVLLFPIDRSYNGSLNDLHKLLSQHANYSILSSFELNRELLTYLQVIRERASLCILTSDTIQDAPEFAEFLIPVFNEIYSAAKIKLSKTDPEIYLWVANQLKQLPSSILFIDDSEENISAANTAGLNTIRYNDNQQLLHDLAIRLMEA